MSRENGSKRIPKFDKYRIHNQCSRKKGFTTSKDANQAIHKVKTKKGIKLNYYRCEYCGKYHLTKKFVRSKF